MFFLEAFAMKMPCEPNGQDLSESPRSDRVICGLEIEQVGRRTLNEAAAVRVAMGTVQRLPR
ncbi:MAG: hypothetical protein DWQ41_20430 [Planctomycetota bacterium]|nr:MAG: hypothetical protein DWQ41_20430 [Planctomycetota bacterium]